MPSPLSLVAVLKLPCQVAGRCQDLLSWSVTVGHDNLVSESVMPKSEGGMKPLFLLLPLTDQPAGVGSSLQLP